MKALFILMHKRKLQPAVNKIKSYCIDKFQKKFQELMVIEALCAVTCAASCYSCYLV